MDLTAPIGTIAIIVATGTFILIIREVVRILWLTMPVWLRYLLSASLAAAILFVLSNL
jgi:hypothetical protein